MGQDFVQLLLSWLPILALVGVFVYFVQRSQSVYTGRSGKTHGEMLEEYVAELRRQNDLIEKAVQDQEARLQRLETTRRSSSGGGGSGGSGSR
jgi:ATP-dependent Zn protease